jgi:hypothetical protein
MIWQQMDSPIFCRIIGRFLLQCNIFCAAPTILTLRRIRAADGVVESSQQG